MDGPFLGSEAVASGAVSRRSLRVQHRAIYRDVYLSTGCEPTAVSRAKAAWLWSGRRAVVAGVSAAALYGSKWIGPDLPAEINRSSGKGVAGIVVDRDTLLSNEIGLIDGIPVTTPTRTAFDLGRRKGLSNALIRLDALANATRIGAADVQLLAERHPGARGLVQLRRALELMDGGAESPQETKTRLLVVDAGLRIPRTQIVVRDETGYPFARLDMGWEDCLVAVEYEGQQHWTDPVQHSRDIDRLVELEALGWLIVRVSAEMLRDRPWVVIERICAALRANGCVWLDERPVKTRLWLDRVA